MDSSRFDEVTKALATSTSRRQTLQRIGGILGGAALAVLFPGLALADNSTAAHFCSTVFGADTVAAAQCTSDAAHHTGLYYNSNCGKTPTKVCCPTNPDGTCVSYGSATCCGSGTSCTNGACAATCQEEGASCGPCPPGQGLICEGSPPCCYGCYLNFCL